MSDTDSRAVPLRRWQKEALDLWESHGMRGVVAVVTGGGKTVFAQHCMQRFWSRYPAGHVTIIVPTLALLDQWYVALVDDLGLSNAQLATYSGRGRPSAPSRVNLMVINTARDRALAASRRADSFLVVDECHRAATELNSQAMSGFYVASLGLSATPERQYDSGLDQYVVPRLGPIIYRYSYGDALTDGVIAPFTLVNVSVDLDEQEQAQWDDLTRRIVRARGDDAEEAKKRLLIARARVTSNARMRVPVAAEIVRSHRGRRTIVFHESIQGAEEVAALLNQNHIRATIYHSALSDVARRENLRLFKRGLFDVLVTCRALDEGLNVPDVEVAVVASSTASVRQRIQRLGRVLRPAPGKLGALIYTLYATPPEEDRLVRETASMRDVASVRWQRASRA